MNVQSLKENLVGSIDTWIGCRIDEMVKANPSLAIPSAYMKRAAHNIIAKNKEGLEQKIDGLSLFLADENGEIDTNTLFEDAKNMLSFMEAQSFEIGIIRGTIGEGMVTIDLPDNILTTILFGSKKSMNITPDDVMELKEILTI